jgi:hypothetical protein
MYNHSHKRQKPLLAFRQCVQQESGIETAARFEDGLEMDLGQCDDDGTVGRGMERST